MDPIELDLDSADDELVAAFAGVVRDLALERLDLTDPLTAIEADRRLGELLPGGSVEFVSRPLLAPPVWAVHRDDVPATRPGQTEATAPAASSARATMPRHVAGPVAAEGALRAEGAAGR